MSRYEYIRLRMIVSLERCHNETGEPHPGDSFVQEAEVERIGIAMNGYEARESLPQFLAENAVQAVMEICGHSDCLAGALIRDHANESIPEGC